jgi:type IV pilus assembly protein PilA
MTVNCPECQRMLDATGLPTGTSITCPCGAVAVVPKQGLSRNKRRALIALVLAGPCLVFQAKVIHNFINFGARARQSECHSNLKAIHWVLTRSDAPTPGPELTFSELGFSPERSNRYSYFLGPGPMEDRSRAQAQGSEKARAIGTDTFRFEGLRVSTLEDLPRDLASQVGIQGTGSKRNFVVACAGDIDGNPHDTPDVWSIASHDRIIQGERVAAGEPYCHVSDVTSD